MTRGKITVPDVGQGFVELATERELQDTVVEMAERLGWETWHDNDSRRNKPGFPDLLLVHPERGAIWFELKSQAGRVRPEQRYWLDLLTAAGQRAMVVRPRDLDAVERLLRGETTALEAAQ